MAPEDQPGVPDREGMAAAYLAAAIAAGEQYKRESRKRLLWQIPTGFFAAMALAFLAAQGTWEGAVLRIALFLSAVVGGPTAAGAYIAMGGSMPDWELKGEPLPRKRVAAGASLGLVVGLVFAVAIWRGNHGLR